MSTKPIPLDDLPLADDCECEFTIDPDDPDESTKETAWHFYRRCRHCGHLWWSLHCPHEDRRCRVCGEQTGLINR